MNTQKNCWTAEEHEAIEKSTRENLWRLIYQHTTIHSVDELIGDFTSLSIDDCSRLAQIHLLMSDTVQLFFSQTVPGLLNRLKKTSEGYHEVSRDIIRGRIDWPKTLQYQLASSSPNIYITRRKNAVYDLVENQVLNYVLRSFLALSNQSLQEQENPESILDPELLADPVWLRRNQQIELHSRTSLKNVYLQKCGELHALSEGLIEKVSRNRNAHYQHLAFVATQLKLAQDEPATYLIKHGSEKILLPLDKNVLYELAVLFAVLKRANAQSWTEGTLSLIGGHNGAVSTFVKDGVRLEIFYQQAPPEFSHAGQYVDYMKKYGLANKSRRPDILLQLTRDKGERCYVIIEVKRSKKRGYIVDGFYKVLGYLKDYQQIEYDGHLLKALLVCWEVPKSNAFEPTENIHISGWAEIDTHIDGILQHAFVKV